MPAKAKRKHHERVDLSDSGSGSDSPENSVDEKSAVGDSDNATTLKKKVLFEKKYKVVKQSTLR